MAPPPPKLPAKPGLANAGASSAEVIDTEVQAVEEELEALKARYDMYFLGVERREPNRWRDEIRKKVMRLKGAFTRNTGLKFRIQSLHARYLSYERLWLRGVREKEEGTSRRDLFKARLRQREEAAGSEAGEAAAAAQKIVGAPGKPGALVGRAAAKETARAPGPQAGVAPPPLPPSSKAPPAPRPAAEAPPQVGGMGETQMRALYNAYLAAKMTCREDVSRLTYEAVAKTVSKQIPELMARFKAKSVEFKVEVKDGKAILKAIPKV